MNDCDVCDGTGGDAVGVAAVPGIPVSLAWCRRCLGSGCAGPYALHWTNLTLAVQWPEDVDLDNPWSDPAKIHASVLQAVEDEEIAEWALDLLVWHEKQKVYTTLREALTYGPPAYEEDK